MPSTELVVQLHVEGIDGDHPLAEQAEEEFREDAHDIAGLLVEERSTPLHGRKGELVELALVLSAPSAVPSVCQLLKLWLERDRKRSVEVTVAEPGEEPFVVRAHGEKISLSVLEESLKAAVAGAVGQSPDSGRTET